MTREEAARVLKYLWIERDENAKLMQQLTTRFFERQEALRIGVAALRPPTPDPDTGLIRCGCGGKAETHELFGLYSGTYMTDCKECATGTTQYNTKKESQDAWNRAIGMLEVEG